MCTTTLNASLALTHMFIFTLVIDEMQQDVYHYKHSSALNTSPTVNYKRPWVNTVSNQLPLMKGHILQ